MAPIKKPRNRKDKKHRPTSSIIKKRAFLTEFATCANIVATSKKIGITPRTHYVWLYRDDKYAADFEAVKNKMAVPILEAEAYRRAVQGVRKLIFYKGIPVIDPETKQPYTEHQYSDMLLSLLLQAHAPEKYRQNSTVKHEGEVGQTFIQIVEEIVDVNSVGITHDPETDQAAQNAV